MMKKYSVIILFIIIAMPFTSIGITSYSDDIVLPPPSETSMILEETIWRRASIRNFTEEPVTDEDLSTILWAAYGLRGDNTRTVPSVEGVHAAHLYVIKPEAVYKYDAMNHTLRFYKEGDYRYVGQYDAPLLIGIVWDTDILADGNLASAHIGMIGQNIQLMSNALDLGTVICGDFPPTFTLNHIGLPPNEIPRIIIPLGHLVFPYNFNYLPLEISLPPRIQKSSFSLSDAIEARHETSIIPEELSKADQIQILWSSYGFSYLLDRADFGLDFHISRHRTVPSAKGYYPLHIYAVTPSMISEYIPNIYNPILLAHAFPRFPAPVITYIKPLHRGDFRAEIANATSNPATASAPLLVIIVLNIDRTRRAVDFSAEEWWWLWYYELGSSVQNMLLTSAAWDLSTTIILPIDSDTIRSYLGLNDNYIPMMIAPVGKT